MKPVLIPVIIAVLLVFLILPVSAGTGDTDAAAMPVVSGDEPPAGPAESGAVMHPVMHLSQEQIDEMQAEIGAAPKFSAPRTGDGDSPATGSRSLLSYLEYIPSQRDQGYCGNCWVWASTAALEIDHAAKTGINDRLSVQYFNSKFMNGAGDGSGGSWACCGGWLSTFTSWYNADKAVIPWSNTNASYKDYYRQCSSLNTAMPVGSITTTPRHTLNSFTYQTVSTKGAGQSAAIGNIKAAINANHAVWYSFFYGDSGWTDFYNFWGSENESVIFDPDPHAGETQTGGHAVLIVGYNDTVPGSEYWEVLNSWGSSSRRPNGIFRQKMMMNYDSVYYYSGFSYQQHFFQIVNSSFVVEPIPLNATKIGVASEGIWALDNDGTFAWNTGDKAYTFGGPGSVSIVGDWNNDTISEIGVFDSGTWLLDANNNGVYDGPGTDRDYTFGSPGFAPVIGDWNGDGTDEIGVELNGIWAIDYNGNGTWDGDGTDRFAAFGQTGDIPVIGDWDGDGADEIGSHLDGFWAIDYNGNYLWDGVVDDRFAGLGQAADKPVIGNFNGDGKDEIGMETDGFWAVDYDGDYVWDGIGEDRFAGLGQAGDTPVVADFDGNGFTEICSYTDGFWAVDYNGNYQWDGVTDDRFAGFGSAGAVPVVGAWS